MKQVISILIENKEIQKIRNKYDPHKEIKTHITLVYPFENINQEKLEEHIKKSIRNTKPFDITLKGLQKSAKEYYLYLLINKGKEKIIEIYEKLNSGILSDFKNPDMPYFIPHITLGIFDSEEKINNAIKNISKENLEIEAEVNRINLITIDNNLIKSVKEFNL